jgi:hypothetical protein
MPTRFSTSNSAIPHFATLGGYLLLGLVMTYPLALHLTTAIPGDGFDGWQNYWNLWWVKTALMDLQQSPYFTDYLYYPTGYGLLFQTLNIFNAFLTLPVQVAFGVTVSYNFVVLFSFVIGGYGAYLLALRVLGAKGGAAAHLAAFLAGVVFSYSPFHFAHLLGHMQVISLEWLPFYVLFLLRSLSSERLHVLPHILLPALFLVLTALCDWYFVLYLLIFTALSLVYRMWVDRRVRLPLIKTGLIVAVTVLVLSPLLWPMVVEAARDSSYLRSPFETTVRLSADLLAFVTPNEFHPVWGQAAAGLGENFTSSTSERMVFAGFIPLALAAYGVWTRRHRAALWAISLLVFFILALGPYLHVAGRETSLPLPYLMFYRFVPFFSIARSVSRFSVMVMLSLGCLVALGLQRVLVSLPQRRAVVVGGLTTVLVCFEFLPAPYPLASVEIPSFYDTLAADESEYAILELPMNWDRPTHLLYQTVHRKPIIAGYVTRPNPLSLVDRTPVLQHFRYLGPDILVQDLGQIAPEVFEYVGAKYAILHEYMLPPGREREANFALVDEVFGGQSPLHEDGWLTVYSTGRQQGDLPFLVLAGGWGEREVREGEPTRALGVEATLTVVSPDGGQARLAFTAFSEANGRPLELWLNEELIGTYEIGDLPVRWETGTLPLAEGSNTLRLRDLGSGKPAIVFTSLEVLGDGGEG